MRVLAQGLLGFVSEAVWLVKAGLRARRMVAQSDFSSKPWH